MTKLIIIDRKRSFKMVQPSFDDPNLLKMALVMRNLSTGKPLINSNKQSEKVSINETEQKHRSTHRNTHMHTHIHKCTKKYTQEKNKTEKPFASEKSFLKH